MNITTQFFENISQSKHLLGFVIQSVPYEIGSFVLEQFFKHEEALPYYHAFQRNQKCSEYFKDNSTITNSYIQEWYKKRNSTIMMLKYSERRNIGVFASIQLIATFLKIYPVARFILIGSTATQVFGLPLVIACLTLPCFSKLSILFARYHHLNSKYLDLADRCVNIANDYLNFSMILMSRVDPSASIFTILQKLAPFILIYTAEKTMNVFKGSGSEELSQSFRGSWYLMSSDAKLNLNPLALILTLVKNLIGRNKRIRAKIQAVNNLTQLRESFQIECKEGSFPRQVLENEKQSGDYYSNETDLDWLIRSVHRLELLATKLNYGDSGNVNNATNMHLKREILTISSQTHQHLNINDALWFVPALIEYAQFTEGNSIKTQTNTLSHPKSRLNNWLLSLSQRALN
ncbi:MAG: hypothetical protein Tsb0021_03620 [Chlamydiales bacterium]